MKKIIVSLLFVILPFLGLFDSGYVTYEIFSGKTPICRPPFQCATVLDNKWAYIAGLPLSFYGLIFYIIVLFTAMIHLLRINQQCEKSMIETLRKLAKFGFIFAFYVLFLMAFIIKAWCSLCLGSAIILTLLFINSRFLSTTAEEK